jgi:hypothetical protein
MLLVLQTLVESARGNWKRLFHKNGRLWSVCLALKTFGMIKESQMNSDLGLRRARARAWMGLGFGLGPRAWLLSQI